MSLLQMLFGQLVIVIGEDGQQVIEAEEAQAGGWADKLRAMFDFAETWQYPPFDCQNCGKPMRGPRCPHCGEIQSGYDYNR